MQRSRLLAKAAVLAAVAVGPAPAWADSFPTVVRAVLDGQTTGRLAQMDRDQRAEAVTGADAVLLG